jgi:hypothetical protein
MRDVDEVWLEGEDGRWVRLADVLLFEIHDGAQRNGLGEVAVQLPARLVAVMRYDESYLHGSRDLRPGEDGRAPVRVVISMHPDTIAAGEAMRNLLVEAGVTT